MVLYSYFRIICYFSVLKFRLFIYLFISYPSFYFKVFIYFHSQYLFILIICNFCYYSYLFLIYLFYHIILPILLCATIPLAKILLKVNELINLMGPCYTTRGQRGQRKTCTHHFTMTDVRMHVTNARDCLVDSNERQRTRDERQGLSPTLSFPVTVEQHLMHEILF